MSSIWSGISIPPAEVLNSVNAGDRTISVTAARSCVRLVYGTDRFAAQLLNILPSADGKKLVVQALWGFALDSISDLKLNDQDLPSTTTVTNYTGTQTIPDPDLVAAMAAQGITYTKALQGYAYSVLLMPISAFDGQLNVSALLRGRRLYDPRQDSTNGGSGPHRLNDSSTWTYSDNPALVLADWTRSSVYGAGLSVVWPSVMTTAAACDALVGSERRRIVSFSTTGSTPCKTIAETLRAYAGCWCVPTAAGVTFIPDQDQAPVDTITHADGRLMRLDPLVLADNMSSPTAVEVLYTDTTQTPWAEGSAIAQLAGAGTTRPWRLSQVRMPGIQRYSQAMREATERLNKLTLCPMSTTIEVADEGIKYERADIIQLSHPAGLALQPMRVLDVSMQGLGTWVLQLQEHDPAVYSDSVQTKPVVPSTPLDSPTGPPDNVDLFDVLISAGNLRRFNFGYSGDKPPLLAGVQIRYRSGPGPVTVADWDSLTPLGSADDVYSASFETSRPPAGTWTFAARAIRMSGQRADSVITDTITLPAPFPENDAPDPTPPPTPTNMTVTPGVGLLIIKHDTPTYTQGHGHGKTRVYAKQWTSGPLPVFADAELVTEFTGPIGTFATALGTTWRLWTKWVTMDDYESVAPAGGTNGIEGTTGKIGSADLAPLAVTAAALGDGAVNLGSAKVTGTITDPARFGAVAVGYTVTQYLLATSGLLQNLVVDNAQIGSLDVSKLNGGTVKVGAWIQSTNYVAGASGWRINANGTAEFRGITIAGPSTFDGQVTMRNPDGSIQFQSGGKLPYSQVSNTDKPRLLTVSSHGYDRQLNTLDTGIYLDGSLIWSFGGPGFWNVVLLHPTTLEIYDVFKFGGPSSNTANDAAAWINFYRGQGTKFIVVVLTDDNPQASVSVSFVQALTNCGASTGGVGSAAFAGTYRSSYSFIGQLNTLPGTGIEVFSRVSQYESIASATIFSGRVMAAQKDFGLDSGNVSTFIADATIPAAKIGSLSVGLISTGINGGLPNGIQIVQNVISVYTDSGAEVCTLGRLT